jgi:hypothetical protein
LEDFFSKIFANVGAKSTMIEIRFFFVFVFFTLSSSLSFPSELGKCIHDPNAGILQEKWKHYHELKKKRAHINASIISKTIKMDLETLKLIQAISEVEKLITILDELEVKYLKKSFVDLRFNEMISHPSFISKLESKDIDAEIHSSELPFKDDPNFFLLLDFVRSEVARPEVKSALDLFRVYEIGVLEKNNRKSAKSALRLIRKKGATLQAVREWLTDPPYLRNVPLPSVKLGPFAVRYRALIVKSVKNFVEERTVTLLEARKLFPRIKQAEVEEMNTILAPTEINSFDEHVVTTATTPQDAAIDGVARTLWGEASSCQQNGLPQFEAIGRIIADRSMAVGRARLELQGYAKKSEVVREENWSTFLKNWVGIRRPAPGMQNRPVNHLRGLSDFGRKEKIELPDAAQVISKKGQFSVWNSFSIKRYHTGQFNKNIPDAVYEIHGPQTENDDKALVRILCPEFQNQEQKDLWLLAGQIAQEIVLRPEALAKRISWPVNAEILFYTHEAPLPFAKEIKVPHILVGDAKKLLRGKGHGACNHFRLFVPKIKGQY